MFAENNIDEDELMIRISLNKDFKRNDYGEAIFYKDSREILTAVYPKMGRMVVWNATVPFIFKPPAMSYVQAQFDILVRVTTSKEKAKQAIAETKVLCWTSTAQNIHVRGLSEGGHFLEDKLRGLWNLYSIKPFLNLNPHTSTAMSSNCHRFKCSHSISQFLNTHVFTMSMYKLWWSNGSRWWLTCKWIKVLSAFWAQKLRLFITLMVGQCTFLSWLYFFSCWSTP